MSLFTMTSENSLQKDSEQTGSALKLSSAGFPVNLTALLASALRKMTIATYGESVQDCFAKFAPDGQLLKMYRGCFQAILDGSLQEFSGTLPRQGMMHAGLLMALPTLERPTKGTEFSSWPSPHSNCHTGAGEHGDGGQNIQTAVLWRTPSATDGTNGGPNARDSSGAPHLSSQVLWPTASVCGNYNRKGSSEKSGEGLATAVANWPTPTVPNGGRSPKGGMSLTGMTPDGKKRQVDLQYACRQWPTPAAQDGKNATLPPSQSERDTIPGAVMRQGQTGSLNADWVSLLMGFPASWTDIDCDDPAPWPGWPAGMGQDQYDYEPPCVITGQKNRAKRLKCLGNAVVPQQAAPIFVAIMKIDGRWESE